MAMLAKAARRGVQAQIRHVSVIPYRDSQGLVRAVYTQVERDFGMLAPPVGLHAPAPEALAACWLMLRQTLLASGQAPSEVKEMVAAAVSQANRCPYCVEVHGSALHPLVRGRDAAAVIDGRLDEVTDARLRRIAEWAQQGGSEDDRAGRARPFPDEQAAELIGVAATFHYLNRMVNVFLADSPLPPRTPAVLRGGIRRLFGRILGAAARGRGDGGDSLDLLPDAELPADLSWAAADPGVAAAFARAAAAIDRIGRRTVPGAVRAVVTSGLANGHGPAGPGRAWVETALGGLPAAQRPAGRLALLTAHASYRIDQAVIDDFRRDRPGDEALIGLTSWAGFAAARAAARRLHTELRQTPTQMIEER